MMPKIPLMLLLLWEVFSQCSVGGCESCPTSLQECQVCNEANFFYLSGSTCCNVAFMQYPDGKGGCSFSCSEIISGCFFCNFDLTLGQTVCTGCEPFFYPSGTICCDGSSLSYPDGEGGCSSCDGILEGCLTCIYNQVSGSTECTQCDIQNGYELSITMCCDTKKGFQPEYFWGFECSTCDDVSFGCETCSRESEIATCTTCKEARGYYLTELKTCCNINLADSDQCSQCEQVILGCQTCSVLDGVIGCIECDGQSGYQLSGISCCDTNSGYIPDGIGGCIEYVAPCEVAGCQECSQASSSVCVSCNTISGYVLNGDICCNINEEYPNGLNVCTKCSDTIEGCMKCTSDGQVSCSECDAENGFLLSGTQCCSTLNQIYPSEGSCAPCATIIPGCTSCQMGADEVICNECDSNTLFFLSGQTCCDTANHAFPDKEGGCVGCSTINHGCLICYYNPSTFATDCIECISGFRISGTVCCDESSTTPDGQGGCTGCPQGCLSCSSTGFGVQCSTCNSELGYEISGGSCCDTSSGNYPDGNGGCSPCSAVIPGCFFCFYNQTRGITACTACASDSGYYPSRDICCSANDLSYPDGFGGCSSCSGILTGCTTCEYNQIFAATQCTACNTGNGFLLSGVICCDTNAGEFPNGDGECGTCQEMIPGCELCSLAECESCNALLGFYPASPTECCNTNSGLYPTPSGCSYCYQAIDGCQTCVVNEGLTQCSFCRSPDYVVSGAVCCQQSIGEFPDGNGGCSSTALPCIVGGCLQCSQSSNTVCISCNTGSGFLLSGVICCDTNAGEFPNGDGECGTCQEMIPGCELCSLAECESCNALLGFYPASPTECCNTNSGLYPTPSGCSYCYQAIDGCQTCVVNEGLTQCSVCRSPDYVVSGAVCCQQSIGYLPDGNGGCILACTVEGCLQCSSSSNTVCISCDTSEGFALNGNICCDTNSEFANGLNVCSDCSELFSGCLKCSSEAAEVGMPAGCLQCDKMNGFIISGVRCCNTNIQQYPDGNGNCGRCENIVSGCTSCLINTAQVQCLSCDENSLFFMSGSTCCDTGNDAFPDKDGGCVSCSSANYGCVSCSYNSATLDVECSQCDSGFTISGTVCCENSVGVPDGNGGCTGCPLGCLSCSFASSIECSVCDSTNFFYLSETVCCNAAFGQFPNGQGGCSSCSEILRGCFFCAYNLTRSLTECTACDISNQFYPSRDICCDTNSLQYPDGFGGCSSCGEVLTGCLTCTFDQVTASTECTSCDTQNGFLISENFCCDTKREQYPGGYGYEQCLYCTDITGCLACDYDEWGYQITCKTCDNENGFALSGTVCCDSKQDEFPDAFGSCQSCATHEAGCIACAFNPGNTVCTACDSFNGFQLSLAKCCNTLSHQYPDGSGECAECSQLWSGCLTCAVNDGVTECTSCDASNGFEISGVLCCNTNNGESPDGNGGCLASVPCTVEGCIQCSEGSSTACVSCDTGLGYVLSGETCCGVGEYANGPNVCTPCSSALPGCLTCSSENGLRCSTCDFFSGYLPSGDQCCDANASQYPNGNGRCAQCSVVNNGCLACYYNLVTSTTECSECSAGFTRSGTVCCDDSISTPDGEGGCIGCPTGCLTCSTNAGILQCSSCDTQSGFFQSGSICCDTGSGSFPDGKGGCSTCSEVLSGCLLCSFAAQSAQTRCSTCQTSLNFYLSRSVCCDTNSLQYPNGEGGCSSCTAIQAGCLTCIFSPVSASTECTSCDMQNGFALSGTVCCDSKQDEFPDAFGSCQSCATHEAGCIACAFNPGNTVCTACDSFNGFQLSLAKCCNTLSHQYPDGSGECAECSQLWSGCLTCAVNDGVTECTSCDASNGFEISGVLCCNTNNGESPDGNGGCLASVPCTVEGCIQCSEGSSTACVSCDTGLGYVLSGETCCGVGEYANGPNVCTPCSSALPGCLTCSSENGLRCSTCDFFSGYLPSGDQCCDANASQYPNGNGRCAQCSVVNNGCLACYYNLVTSTTECSECSAGFTRSGTVCCDDSISTPDGEGGCIGCPTGCLTCSTNAGILQCSSCDTQSGFFQSGSICCDTGSGSFPDGKGGCSTCSEVLSGCLLCSFAAQSAQTRCSTCQTSLNFYLSRSVCCDTNSLQYPNGEGGCSSCTAIQAGCLTCIFSPVSASTECTSCDMQNGFALSGTVCCDSKQDEFPDAFGSCQSCATHEAGCIACAFNPGNTVCTACDSFNGFQLSLAKCCNTLSHQYPDGSGECAECSQLWSGCLTCAVNDGVTECTSCDASNGFEISGVLCCNTNNGESPDGNGGCLASVPCTVEGCIQCSEGSSTACVSCDTGLGYVLSGETCCGVGEYANGPNVCTPCSSALPGCLTCSSENGLRCSTCDFFSGYLPSGDQCCDANASQYPNGNGRCAQCSVVNNGCLACYYNLVTSTTECSECSAGFTRSGTVCCDDSISTPDGEGGCIGCPTGCLTCQTNADTLECLACNHAQNYYLSGSSCCNMNVGIYPDNQEGCSSCGQIILGCLTCIYKTAEELTVCSSCESSSQYYLSGETCCNGQLSYPNNDGGCSSCGALITGCLICNFNQASQQPECIECDTQNAYELSGAQCCDTSLGLYPSTDNSCTSCFNIIPNCLTCKVVGSATTCEQCVFSHALVGGGCQFCSEAVHSNNQLCVQCSDIDENCKKCVNETTCVECLNNLPVLADGSGCLPSSCSAIDLNCALCSDSSTCTFCQPGYALVLNTCSQCEDDQYVSQDGTSCLACDIIQNCYSCKDEYTCINCNQNYALTSPSTCQLCTSVQTISNDGTYCVDCSSIDAHCVSCSSESVCTFCSEGYIVYGLNICQLQSCQLVDPYCVTCEGSICSSCSPGYALMGGDCVPCGYSQTVTQDGSSCVDCEHVIPNCLTCSSQTYCTSCTEGLVLISPTICEGCGPGMVMAIDKSGCVACTLPNCAQCETQFVCKTCASEYIHDPFINQCVQLQTLSLTCGNHYQLSEGCDDGNTQSGDGCSSTCQVEDGYYCVNFVGFVSECKENCGNGVVDNGETCDDGNTNSFDGCSSSCQVEIKYSCSNGGCSRNCGNNNIDAGENCDDGNERGGDGCSSDCLVESGWSCSSYPCMPICGDGRKLGGEFCDDGNAYRGDGCSPQCSIELGWQCEGSYGQKSVCRPFEDFCGNAVRDFIMGQLCDDGNKINGDGCNNQCVIQSGWLCNTNVIPNKCSRCGNGKADAGESCDDGNLFNKDGCNENCQLELGFECSQYFPAKCLKIVPCYDGSFDPLKEACDDGNTNNEDGCNIQCQIQEGWECQNKVGEASKCSLIPVCGNARLQLQNGEQCDDGNKSPHDGCDQNCALEQHFQCRLPLGEKSVCERHYECGNGLQEAANLEQCDDGNNQNNDGCTANCQIERNYICLILRNGRSRCTQVTTNTPQVSTFANPDNNGDSNFITGNGGATVEPTVVNRCGDGVKTSGEECDDRDEMSGDGCSSVCRVERGYECRGDAGEQSWCRKLCGNLVRNPGEQCDDGNEINGDGCTSECRRQAGNFCPIVGGCVRLCGNGQVDSSFAEACDDSNSVNGDGCSDTCRVEAGWKCDILSNGTSRCSSFCGNAALQPNLGEQCDDGNVQTGDGCSNCRIQPSWRCSSVISQRSVCTSASVPYCGNAKYEPLIGEECDDGNEINTDGCSNRCVQNPNFLCSNVPGLKSMCSSQDDGICVAGGEPPSFRLSPSEIEAMRESELSFVVSMADLVSALVSRDAAGQIVVDPIQSTQARNLYYAQDLFHEWFIVNYYVQKCQGQP